MFPAIALALKLATVAPTLMTIFGSKEPTVQAAQTVIDTAIAVTGAATGESALTQMQASSADAFNFELKIRELAQELVRLQYADLSDARKRDSLFVEAGRTNKRASVMLGCVFIMLLLGLSAVVFMSDLDEFAKTILNLLIGRLLGYVDQAFNFEFGTTRNSKDKDETINRLAGDK